MFFDSDIWNNNNDNRMVGVILHKLYNFFSAINKQEDRDEIFCKCIYASNAKKCRYYSLIFIGLHPAREDKNIIK